MGLQVPIYPDPQSPTPPHRLTPYIHPSIPTHRISSIYPPTYTHPYIYPHIYSHTHTSTPCTFVHVIYLQWSTNIYHVQWSTIIYHLQWSTIMYHSQWSTIIYHSQWSTSLQWVYFYSLRKTSGTLLSPIDWN